MHMRRLIFILMIALLPLQGWTSVAMSTEMASMQLLSSNTSVLHQSSAKSIEMSPECALRMSAASSQAVDNDDTLDRVCTDCQACHLIALAESVHIVNKVSFIASFERSAGYYFASADLQLTQKPPIFFV